MHTAWPQPQPLGGVDRDISFFFFFFIWSFLHAARASAYCCRDPVCFIILLLSFNGQSFILSFISLFHHFIFYLFYVFYSFQSVFYDLHFTSICFLYMGLLAICVSHKCYRPRHEVDPLLSFTSLCFFFQIHF